jgi:hypothetical protein
MTIQSLSWAMSLSNASPLEKLVAIALTETAHGDGTLNNFTTLRSIAEFCNVSEDHVRTAIEGLKSNRAMRCDIDESGEISFGIPI